VGHGHVDHKKWNMDELLALWDEAEESDLASEIDTL
jgi:hypothetical protein